MNTFSNPLFSNLKKLLLSEVLYDSSFVIAAGLLRNNPAAITNEESYSTSDSKSFFKLEKSGFENVFNNNFIGSFLSSKVNNCRMLGF